jgi:site-specific DNA recombinase
MMSDEQGRRAAIYARVSTLGQEEEGTSLGTQEARCREYAAKLGYRIPESEVERLLKGGERQA